MDPYQKLLYGWCGYLVSRQTEEGGFSCEACRHLHGRADNAIYPLLCVYSYTKEQRFLNAAERLLDFRSLLTDGDGAVHNDFMSAWKGITAFSAISLYKALTRFGNILPADFKASLEVCFDLSARWVAENIRPGFRANINYYAAAAAVCAMYGKMRNDREITDAARELLRYCMAHFTENGFLTGEGQPHDVRTAKGCRAVDMGYIIEESIPCLTDAAILLADEETLKKLAGSTEKLLDFMLPDGGWDNSFGSRNNKWTYYGSRTSDGCIGAFTVLGRYSKKIKRAAEKTFEILSLCTDEGKLYGGRYYKENGAAPCVHQTFSHACSLADAIFCGIGEAEAPAENEEEKTGFQAKYYPETDTWKITAGRWLATVTANDYSTYTYNRGAAHCSGGTLSLLYHKEHGAVLAGSVYEYKKTEENNMQDPPEGLRHESLILRAETEKDGKKYATCLDGNAKIGVQTTETSVIVKVKAKFVNIEKETADDELTADFTYIFEENEVTVLCGTGETDEEIRLIVPVIGEKIKTQTENKTEEEEIFFLTPGFRAKKYTLTPDDKGKVRFVIKAH